MIRKNVGLRHRLNGDGSTQRRLLVLWRGDVVSLPAGRRVFDNSRWGRSRVDGGQGG